MNATAGISVPIAPVVESLVFGADLALLPYKMGTDPFRCYESNAGYCLPGDPTPMLLYPPQWSLTVAAFEAGTIATLIANVPVSPCRFIVSRIASAKR